ncbi:MAG TPA: hypothetical protein VHE37_00760 [Nevskiaceae bacterium]|nr:hypothetical protein [Nevskiaceae bacterium]
MRVLKLLLLIIVAGVLYLALAPSPLDPVRWQPPVPPGLEGPYLYNEKLKGIEKLGVGTGTGPEAVVADAQGSIYTGFLDGRVMQFSADGSVAKELVNTHGRPLGVALGEDNTLLIADAFKGLLQLDGKNLSVLSNSAGGVPFGFTDDVDHAAGDDWVYFSDASYKFGFGHHIEDALEHGGNGRLLAYNLKTKETKVLLGGLHFANGIALGPGGEYVLVNLTTEYRVLRYWLKGEKAGTSDVFIDNLPGFPDNITFNGRDTFWLALYAPRDALLDRLLPGPPWVRKLIARLPASLQPKPKMHSFALGLSLDGKVSANLQYRGPDAFAPITSVREHGEYLYFGSLSYPGFGRIALKSVLPD